MSALGHKRTFAVQNCMSALPPKADICSAVAHVRFGPIADVNHSVLNVCQWLKVLKFFKGRPPTTRNSSL